MNKPLDAVIPTSPLVDAGGNVNPEWRVFFTTLQLRTGGIIGQATDTTVLEAEIAAETAARQAADGVLSAALTTEQAARTQGDAAASQALANEAQARLSGDQANAARIYSETQARIAADANFLTRQQLCSAWAGCNLSFLPTSDPGHGQPWLSDNVVCVGTSALSEYYIDLEDGSGRWTMETPSVFDWLWG